MTPKVSVVMPMYNAAPYADEAIRSIRNQSVGDFELLIIDDGSSDGSAQIAARHEREDKRVILHGLAHEGISHAMNFGLAKARGEYVAIMHADDVASQNRFERQIQVLDRNHDIGVLGTAYRLVNQNGKVIAKIGNPERPEQCRAALLAGNNCICNHSAMVRRGAFEQAGLYLQELWPSEDYDMWLRISEFTGVANLNECLETYRYHFENASYRKTLQQAVAMVAAQAAAEARQSRNCLAPREVSWEALKEIGVKEEALLCQAKFLYEAYLHWALEFGQNDVVFRLASEFLSLAKQRAAHTAGLDFLKGLLGKYALQRQYGQIGRCLRLGHKLGYSARDLGKAVLATGAKLWEGLHRLEVEFPERAVLGNWESAGYIDHIDLAICLLYTSELPTTPYV